MIPFNASRTGLELEDFCSLTISFSVISTKCRISVFLNTTSLCEGTPLFKCTPIKVYVNYTPSP